MAILMQRGQSGLELPELEGSEKQVAWAEQIRMSFIISTGEAIKDWSKNSAAYECLETLTMAKAWIENRDRLKPEKFIDRVKQLEAEWAAVGAEMHLEDRIAEEERDRLVARDDEALDEVDCYAIVYSDHIIVHANQPGMGKLIPPNRKYIGSVDSQDWRYTLDRLDDIRRCRAIDFCLDDKGNKIEMADKS